MGDSSGGYAPTHVALRANEIVAEGRRLTRLVAGLTPADGGWRANLDADQMHGYAEWRPARAGAAAGRLYARLTRLALPEQAEAQSFESLLDAEPGSVPALDVVIDDFELRGKKLGKVEIEAVNRSDGQREWQLSKLALTTPEAQFVASGQWISRQRRREAPPLGAQLQARPRRQRRVSRAAGLRPRGARAARAACRGRCTGTARRWPSMRAACRAMSTSRSTPASS